jgi:phosphoribosylformimino-5-aminoimidazole carboxamide ribotide isomerase
VATDGWLETSQTSAIELARQFDGQPLAGIVYTDIAKDGMLAGPNLAAMQEMHESIELPLVASGGISSPGDVRDLARLMLAGCIVGRALYEGQLGLADAISAGRGP